MTDLLPLQLFLSLTAVGGIAMAVIFRAIDLPVWTYLLGYMLGSGLMTFLVFIALAHWVSDETVQKQHD